MVWPEHLVFKQKVFTISTLIVAYFKYRFNVVEHNECAVRSWYKKASLCFAGEEVDSVLGNQPAYLNIFLEKGWSV